MLSRLSAPTWLNPFLFLFAISAVVGLVPAYDPNLSTAALFAVLTSVAVCLFVANAPFAWSALRAIGAIMLLAAGALGAYFIVQFGHLGYEQGGFVAQLGKVTTLLPDLHGFTPHPNAAATFLESAAPLGVALVISSRRLANRIVLGIGTAVIVYALFLTASRGAWLALGSAAGIAAAVAAMIRLPRRAAIVMAAAGAAAAIVVVFAVAALGPDRLPFLASTFSRAADRGTLFQNSLYLAGDYALTGAGLGDTFPMVYSRYSLLIRVPYLTYAHNLPLSVWLNQGLLGLIALAGMLASLYLLVYRVIRTAHPPPLFHGAWLGATAVLLHGLTDAPQYAAGSYWVMPMTFAAIGLTAGTGRLAMAEARVAHTLRLVPRHAAAGAFIAMCILIALFHQPIRAAWHTNLGAIYEAHAELAANLTQPQRREGFDSAIAAYESALAIDPGQPSANRRLGNLLVNLDRFNEAVPLLEKAYQAERTNPAAIKGLGLAYVWVGRTDDAARAFHQVDSPVDMSNELYVWGNYRGEQNRPLLAAYAYETAQKMYPDTAEVIVWLLIADEYRAASRLDTARLWYNRVLEAEPHNERALDALSDIGP